MIKLGFIWIAILYSIWGFSQEKHFSSKSYLETVAKVDTFINPDKIYLNILITEKDTKNKISVEELENKMMLELKSLGIDLEKRLTLFDLESGFKTYFFKKKNVLKSKSYELETSDVAMAGNVLVRLEHVGISNVTLNRIECSDIENIRLELRSKAVLKAKQQANYLIRPLSQTLGKAIYISDNYFQTYNSVGQLKNSYKLKSKKSEDSIKISFKLLKVESKVLVRFELL